MLTQKDLDQFMDKVKKLEKGERLDLSSDEDLSIAVMNLISIEEHLFFSAGKTGKTKYYDLLHEIREMRKQLMKQLVRKYEGEGWCISKHLLAASMRLMEVGTKALTKGESDKAYDLFQKSYDLYNLFWGINTDLIQKGDLKKIDFDKKEEPIPYQKNTFLAKISGVVGKILDCCKE
jgi:hypothetical protein